MPAGRITRRTKDTFTLCAQCSHLPLFGEGPSVFPGPTICGSAQRREGFWQLLWLQMVTQDNCPPWLKGGKEGVRSEQNTLFLIMIRDQEGCATPVWRGECA